MNIISTINNCRKVKKKKNIQPQLRLRKKKIPAFNPIELGQYLTY